MAITFPLALNEFWDRLPISEVDGFEIKYNQSFSKDGAGNIYESRVAGSGRWHASVRLDQQYFSDEVDVEALINTVIGRAGAFYAYDKRNPYPLHDPDGTIIAGSSVQIKSKESDNRSISLKGLPASYRIARGDRISVTTATNQRILLEMAENRTATVGGETAVFEVSPVGLPVGLAINDTVDLVKPVGKFRILPGSFKPSTGAGNLSGGLSFTMYSVIA